MAISHELITLFLTETAAKMTDRELGMRVSQLVKDLATYTGLARERMEMELSILENEIVIREKGKND